MAKRFENIVLFPRLLVIFRPQSRHTYGFKEGGTYDLPQLELQTLIREGDFKDIHIDFIPVMNGINCNKQYERHGQTHERQSRNQLKKKRPWKNHVENRAQAQSMYWIESSYNRLFDNVISSAASRAILTHALFRVECTEFFSEDDWKDAIGYNNEGRIQEFLRDHVDVVNMSNPNMSNEERFNLLERISNLLQSHDDILQYLQRQFIKDKDNILIYHISSPPPHEQSGGICHCIHIGIRMAIGPAGTSGSPGLTLRRTHRGILKEYALKSRFGVTAARKRSNISTAMEPEIGFLMGNLALAGCGSGQRVLDPCCGSGSLLLYAAALGATTLVGVDSDSSVWKNAENEFKRHTSVIKKRNNVVRKLSTPNFFHGDVLNHSSIECLHWANSFDAIICDPPYNVGAPILIGGQDFRPINYHNDGGEKYGYEYDEKMKKYDILPSILAIARRVLVDGGRLVFFLPARGDEMYVTLERLLLKKGWKMSASDEQLQIQFGRLQFFSPTFARWLVCMTKSAEPAESEKL